jgi:ABC-type transporter Mla subunit MlaD
VTIAYPAHKPAFYPCAIAKRRSLIVPAVVLGVLLLVVAVVYWAQTAGSLPSFFPGHKAGSSTHHVKHGVAALVVALACFAFAWFQSGPTRERDATGRPAP